MDLQHVLQYKLRTDLCNLDKPVMPFAWSPWVTQVLQQRLRSKLARLLDPPQLDLYVSLVACPKAWMYSAAVMLAIHCNEPYGGLQTDHMEGQHVDHSSVCTQA